MVESKSQRHPRFFWRGLLITLPVMVLTVAGFLSLRQDRLLVEHEARERAQELADTLVPTVWSLLTNRASSDLPGFTIGADEELVFPPQFALTPMPRALEGDELDTIQRQPWLAARSAGADGGEPVAVSDAWLAFVDTRPPSNYLAAARYALGLSLLKAGQTDAAAEQLRIVVEQFSGATGETGLPLQPLAQFQLLALARSAERTAESYHALGSNVVYHPTLLTPYLLNKLAALADQPPARNACDGWVRTWANHETARRIAAAYRERSATAPNRPSFLWLAFATNSGDPGSTPDRWLVVSAPGQEGERHFLCHRESDLARQVPTAVSATARVPAYFAVELVLAGQMLPVTLAQIRRNGSQVSKVMAVATRDEGGMEALRVTVVLADPAALFQRQRARSFWFGSLIAIAAVTAWFGFLGTWRAYDKQRRLNELKSNFVSSVSHELRAPIASVRLMAESLDRGKIPDPVKQREYFRFISQECRRLSALIENVLDFARIEQGRKQYEFEAADLAALMRNTVTLMEPAATERGVKLALEIPQTGSEGLAFTVDAKALQQALVNLVDNAIKHSPPQSTVTLGLEPGDPVQMWVADHGPGIPPEEQGRIFERFYRRGSELRRETQGVGIGLSIVKHIVEAHGGRVVVRSSVGEGSRFTIKLPTNTGTRDNERL
jgi:signal transduction histidine kinase